MSSKNIIYALGFSYWKRKTLKLCFYDKKIRFVSDVKKVKNGSVLVVWGMYDVQEASKRGLVIIRVEDGFIRSVGLGAGLIKPLSWVIDRRGMHFNSMQPSDMEVILSETNFSTDLIERTKVLCDRIISDGLTKYNVGTEKWKRPENNDKVILVPGQVEGDASITYGSPVIKTNIGLLQTVRETNPDAYVIYKPHPDVVAGFRAEGKGEEAAQKLCNEIIIDVSMNDLLKEVDEVHCLTSLTGFEALLRAKKVTCYGQPFYAGWGLTHDIVPIERRMRRLSIYELAAGALILYPCYMSQKSNSLTTPEKVIDELLEWRIKNRERDVWWRKISGIILKQVLGVR